jgi:hypothetical protein
MCFSAQDIEGIGRVIGMTTWKNLGGVYEGQPATWLTHCHSRRGTGGDQRCRGATVHAEFEGVELLTTGEAPVCWYKPFFGRRVTALFTEEPTIVDKDWSDDIPRWDLRPF